MGNTTLDIARRKYLEYLFSQYQKGVLDKDKIELLKKEGFIKDKKADFTSLPIYKTEATKSKKWTLDPFITPESYSKFRENISKEHWMPDGGVLYHSEEFVYWINSMLYGVFPNKVKYIPFERYKAQAYRWLQDNDNITDYRTDESRREYVYREMDRITENTLYFANKYGELKEGDIESGIIKYQAKEHHAVLFYLFDCGYNVIGGKGRQIGFTSALGICSIKKMLVQNNYYIKFIAEDKDTTEEIFNDKIKYPFGSLPRWMQPPVKSDAGNRFWLSDKPAKGKKGYPNSRIDVIAPKKTAINGGSPQLVLIDEIGNIFILTPMLNEGRPTMFWNDPVTGEFKLKRQVWMWGTGGEMDRGKGAYEKEWYRILGLWEAKKYDMGFVPIFFSWHVRLNKEEYEKEKAWYYGARALEKDIDLESSKIQFHQHYPTSFKDMFLTSANTLVSREIIEGGIERCRALGPTLQPIYGYLEPIYDYADPMPPESDVPFRIVDATFIILGDNDPDYMASIIVFQRPEYGWVNRYWQGTDPISTETGHSKQASVIWDDEMKTISAVLNYRKQHDHKYVFLQTLLLGLYYDTSVGKKMGIKELVEANIGTNYIDYKEAKGFLNSLIFNAQLPTKVMGGARDIGIDNKGNRSDAIIEYLTEVVRTYHMRIFISVIFDQLTTFVYEIKATTGKESWGPQNKLMHYDDVLFALAYAYICRLSCSHMTTYKNDALNVQYKMRYELTRDADYNLIRVPVKRRIVKPIENAKLSKII
jgi:hypothetical protein